MIEQVNGPNPPVKATVPEYGTPALAAGKVVEVSVKGAIVTSVKLCVAVTAGLSLSATLMVKLLVPVVVGVPEIAPAALKERPAGKEPDDTVKVYGAIPPDAASVALYAMVVTAMGTAVVVIETEPALTTKVNC